MNNETLLALFEAVADALSEMPQDPLYGNDGLSRLQRILWDLRNPAD